jgi:hypothetical protein
LEDRGITGGPCLLASATDPVSGNQMGASRGQVTVSAAHLYTLMTLALPSRVTRTKPPPPKQIQDGISGQHWLELYDNIRPVALVDMNLKLWLLRYPFQGSGRPTHYRSAIRQEIYLRTCGLLRDGTE